MACLVCLALLAGGCKKNKNTDKTGFLTKSAWKFTSVLHNGVEEIEDCEKDDTETYSTDGTYTGNIGADDCSGSEHNYSGTWKFINNYSQLVYDVADTINIINLDGSTFKYSYTDEPTYILTMNH